MSRVALETAIDFAVKVTDGLATEMRTFGAEGLNKSGARAHPALTAPGPNLTYNWGLKFYHLSSELYLVCISIFISVVLIYFLYIPRE